MNNTINHVKDDAQYVKFNPTGDWSPDITNVQAALSAIKGFAVDGLPFATESVAGISKVATQEEVDAGTIDNKFVTPKTLAVRMSKPDATKVDKGITRYATNAEALSGKENIAIGPDTLAHYFTTKKASEEVQGTIKICSLEAAKIGSDDTMAVTPKKMHTAIAQIVPGMIPEQNTASEQRDGLVRLATTGQALAGTIREGFSISPYTFANARANENQAGTVKIANQNQMNEGNDDSVVVSARKFANTRATTGQFGVVKLTDNPGDGQANAALSSNARVLSLNGGVVSGDVYKGHQADGNQFMTKGEMDGWIMPVGGIILTAFNSTDHGIFKLCNGQWLNKHQYPVLFARIGFTYGGDGGDNFALPDMRGLVVRGCDHGRGLDPGRGYGTYQDDTMQRMTGQFPVANRWRGHFNGVFHGIGGQWNTNYKNGKGDDWGAIVDFDSARQVRTSGETRVKSIALNYMIRVQ